MSVFIIHKLVRKGWKLQMIFVGNNFFQGIQHVNSIILLFLLKKIIPLLVYYFII